MTSNTFMNDENRNNENPVVLGGGDFGEVDSPDGSAPDISSPLSTPEYGTDRPGPHDEDIIRDGSAMRGLAEHGYDGTGNLQAAVDSDTNTGEDSTSSTDSDTEEYSDGSFQNETYPAGDANSQGFSTQGLGQTPGSVMRNDNGGDLGSNLSPSDESTGGYGGNLSPAGAETGNYDENLNSAGNEENAQGTGSLRDDASDHSDSGGNDGHSKDDVMGNLRDKLEDAKHNLFGNDQKR